MNRQLIVIIFIILLIFGCNKKPLENFTSATCECESGNTCNGWCYLNEDNNCTPKFPANPSLNKAMVKASAWYYYDTEETKPKYWTYCKYFDYDNDYDRKKAVVQDDHSLSAMGAYKTFANNFKNELTDADSDEYSRKIDANVAVIDNYNICQNDEKTSTERFNACKAVIDSGTKFNYPKEKDSAQEILNDDVCNDEYSFNTPKYKKCVDDNDVYECNKIVNYCSQSNDIAKEVYSAEVIVCNENYVEGGSEYEKCVNDQDLNACYKMIKMCGSQFATNNKQKEINAATITLSNKLKEIVIINDFDFNRKIN